MKTKLKNFSLALLPLAPCLLATSGLAQSDKRADTKIDDDKILAYVEDKYLLDEVVDLSAFEVDVRQGIVELSGEVDSLLEKQRATRIAELVKGVRAVSNRLEVDPDIERWDYDIQRDIQAALLRDPAADSYEVKVDVTDGSARLTGEVDSWAERELAGKLAKEVAGVKALRNELTLKLDGRRADSEVLADVKQRLHWDILVSDGQLDATVEEGMVTLKGSVASAAERRRAEELAWVAGAMDVKNDLKVEWWRDDDKLVADKAAKLTDEKIENALYMALAQDPRVFAFEVKAEVDDGYVTLRGGVDNLEARLAAQQLAEDTVGVTFVNNKIRLQASVQRPDDEIARDLKNAYFANTLTSSYQIDVHVRNGKAVLNGEVDTWLERAEAERIAKKTYGVDAVHNHLKVSSTNEYITPLHDFGRYQSFIPVQDWKKIDDDQIERDIRTELWWNPIVEVDEVRVKSTDGVVTLSGTVDSMREYYQAQDDAFEGGARRVVNELVIGSQ